MNIFATWTCPKCKQSFRDSFDAVKDKGHVICGTLYEKLTHIPVIVCDGRENRSGVPHEIERLGAEIHIVENMEVADFVVSDRVGFERKTAPDFLQDWIDNRELFSKLYDLKSSYKRAILLYEGRIDDLYTTRGIDPMKVRACINTIANMGIPMLETLNSSGTAATLIWFAAREQNEEKRIIQLHGKRSHLSPKQMKEYVISSFPGCDVGAKTAMNLLNHFGSIEKVITASEDELIEVDGIGKATAEKIRKLITGEYKSHETPDYKSEA